MGLLDEAIRDHLELKRRRGADPTEIARAEREALEPVFPGEAARDSELDAAEGEPTLPVEHAPGGEAGEIAAEAEAEAVHEPVAVDPAFSALGEETAELDVEAYMQAEAQEPPPDPAALAPADRDDEQIEWEEPGRAVEPPPEPIPGQERLSLE